SHCSADEILQGRLLDVFLTSNEGGCSLAAAAHERDRAHPWKGRVLGSPRPPPCGPDGDGRAYNGRGIGRRVAPRAPPPWQRQASRPAPRAANTTPFARASRSSSHRSPVFRTTFAAGVYRSSTPRLRRVRTRCISDYSVLGSSRGVVPRY